MYRNVKNYEIRYTDVDAFDNLKVSSLLSFLEESACSSADELGFGYADISPVNMGFVILNWFVEIYRPIKLGDKVCVHTWPIRPKFGMFSRDFEIYCGDEKVGVCTTRWCMIDTESFSVLPASAFFDEKDFEDYNTERSVVYKVWKLSEITEGEVAYEKNISYSDYDHYFHANNTKYADYMTDVFSLNDFNGKYIKSFQINYIKQCKIGEKLVFVKKYEDGFYRIDGKVNGEIRVQFKVFFVEI